MRIWTQPWLIQTNIATKSGPYNAFSKEITLANTYSG